MRSPGPVIIEKEAAMKVARIRESWRRKVGACVGGRHNWILRDAQAGRPGGSANQRAITALERYETFCVMVGPDLFAGRKCGRDVAKTNGHFTL